MKKLFAGVISNLIILGAFSQAGYPNRQHTPVTPVLENRNTNYPDTSLQPLDSNEDYRNVRDGYVLKAGHLNLDRNGHLFPQRSPVILKNGSIVMTDGVVQMTNGSTPLLRQQDYIDLDGNIRPLRKPGSN